MPMWDYLNDRIGVHFLDLPRIQRKMGKSSRRVADEKGRLGGKEKPIIGGKVNQRLTCVRQHCGIPTVLTRAREGSVITALYGGEGEAQRA